MTAEVELGQVTRRVETWNPALSADTEFVYVDIAAVDQTSKRIVGARRMPTADAPSRARQIVKGGDVLVSTVRPNLNAVAQVEPELDGATASTGFTVLRPAEDLDGRYLFHWVRSPQFIAGMMRKATGASYPAVSDRIIGRSTVPLPPIEKQRRIADILDRANTLCTKRRETRTLLDDLTSSIFLDMFGDPRVNPRRWPSCVLGDLIARASDGPHVSPSYVDEGVPFLSTRHVRAGRIEWSDLKYLSQADAEIQWRKCRPERGDVLYTKGGTTGLAAPVLVDDPFAVWVHVALLKPIRGLVDPVWLSSMLNTSFCYAQSQRLTHGIANRDLGLKRMINIEMYAPPIEEQRRFAEVSLRVAGVREQHGDSQREADSLFRSLQHRAFTGQL